MPISGNVPGLSFVPQGRKAVSSPKGRRLEDVLRVLSYRIPRLGDKPISPQDMVAGNPLGSAISSGVLTPNAPLAAAPLPPSLGFSGEVADLARRLWQPEVPTLNGETADSQS